MTIPVADLVLAYELRTEGCCWKLIAWALGTNENTLKTAIFEAEHHGVAHKIKREKKQK